MWVVFFDWKGIVHHEFVPHGQMVNKQLYQEVLANLRDAVHRKRPELWENHTWMLHHDNALTHASLLIRSYLAKHQTSVMPHPPYSPDLAPAATCENKIFRNYIWINNSEFLMTQLHNFQY